ncbi:MAG: membrane dipeptidase [Gemmatimonadaceae bacterium]|nr:membrane dipeptidase [Gemmatimonadaceae bacterium]
MTSRREFLHTGLLATAGAAFLPRMVGGTPAQPASAPLTFDLHTHPGMFPNHGKPGYVVDSFAGTVRGMNTGHLSGAFFSLVGDAPLIESTPKGVQVRGAYAAGEARAEYPRQLALVKAQIRETNAFLALRADDLVRAQREQKVAAFLACEGGEFVDGDPERVDLFHADGLRSLQIVHYVPSALGDLQTQPAQHHGLSALGKAVVKRCNARRLLVDVAHASFETVRDVVSLTTAPIMLSHSILNRGDPSRLLAARSISEEHAKLVASTGGVIGAWPSGYNTSFEEFVDNTKRLIDVVGIDHVGLGTDMDGNLNPVFSAYTQLAQWGDALMQRGLRRDEVNKVLGGNMLRLLRTVIG